MLRSLFTNPLLIRELVSGARQPSDKHAAYPGLACSSLFACLFIAAFALFGDRDDLVSSCSFYIAAVWVQSWLLLRRSGAYSASSIADSEEKAALAVIAASPQGLEKAMLAKLCGSLLPLLAETLLVNIPLAAVFGLWGSVPGVLLLLTWLFQSAIALCGSGVGLWLGWSQLDSASAVKLYRRLASCVALLAVAMCWGRGLGQFFLVITVMYFLLVILPAVNARGSFWAGILAVASMLIMPFMLTSNGTSVIYDAAKAANPMVTLMKARPYELYSASDIHFSLLDQDMFFRGFADDCFRELTGAKKLSDSPDWADQFGSLLNDKRVSKYVMNKYFHWRCCNLLYTVLGVFLVFICCLLSLGRRIRLTVAYS